jgi:hypothetical protein
VLVVMVVAELAQGHAHGIVPRYAVSHDAKVRHVT